MACGVGNCFSCVTRVKTPAGWDYRRACVEGPVFDVAVTEFASYAIAVLMAWMRTGQIFGKTAVMLRLHSNAIEQRRIGSHDAIMRVSGSEVQDLTAGKSACRHNTPNVLLSPRHAWLDRT